MVSGASEGIDLEIVVVFCVFLVIWGVLEHHFNFENESRVSRTKIYPTEEDRARKSAGHESAVECH